MNDIQLLHQLRKILKSILYVMPLCKRGEDFLKEHKKFMKSLESKIGSLHDTNSFVTWVGKKYFIIHASEERALIKIKHQWQKDIMHMKEDLQQLRSPGIRQVALELKDLSQAGLLHSLTV